MNHAPHERLLALIFGFWQARALAAVTELGIADLLASGPLHVKELARATKTDPQALYRLLRALESLEIFSETAPQIFANTAVSERLSLHVPNSHGQMVLHYLSKGYGTFDGWSELRHALKTGKPSVKEVLGHDFWEHCRLNPLADKALNETMRSLSEIMTPSITEAYDWSQFPVIADIGGGLGAQLVSILDASPLSKGILFDQPHVVTNPISHARMDVVGGDFFEAIPVTADAYLLRWILHDWDDTDAAKLLSCVRKVMKPTARLVLGEFIIPEGPKFAFSKWTDLQMLVLVGGRERTKSELGRLLSNSGFEIATLVDTKSPVSLLIAKIA